MRQYCVDAFTEDVFHGNQAAVCVMEEWPDEEFIPYWADRLGEEELVAYQASERGGTLYCRKEGEKVFMAGKATLYSIDELFVE